MIVGSIPWKTSWRLSVGIGKENGQLECQCVFKMLTEEIVMDTVYTCLYTLPLLNSCIVVLCKTDFTLQPTAIPIGQALGTHKVE